MAGASSQTSPYPLHPFAQARICKYSASAKARMPSCDDPATSVFAGEACAGELASRGRALSRSETERLVRTLSEPAGSGGATTRCYEPRHELIFFDDAKQPIARIQVCLECGVLNGDPPIPQGRARPHAQGRVLRAGRTFV